MKKTASYILSILLFTSCVSSKQFKEVEKDLLQCNQKAQQLEAQKQDLLVKANEQQALLDKLQTDYDLLQKKYTTVSEEQKSLQRMNERLKAMKLDMEEQLATLKAGSSEEISILMDKLQNTQADIQAREDKLRIAENELASKNQRLAELQEAMDRKDKAVKELKEKVINALTGFNNNGLSINERNGKIYVSMDERLLFKTAQWTVDEKGRQALKNLSEVLAKNPDINIMVEGHTDDVRMHGSGEIKDNWDLSVMRSTAVTKILLENKNIDPQRIIAAGRSQYVPVATGKTAEDRQKNRRTEIILTPRLDEIFKLLEDN